MWPLLCGGENTVCLTIPRDKCRWRDIFRKRIFGWCPGLPGRLAASLFCSADTCFWVLSASVPQPPPPAPEEALCSRRLEKPTSTQFPTSPSSPLFTVTTVGHSRGQACLMEWQRSTWCNHNCHWPEFVSLSVDCPQLLKEFYSDKHAT